MSEDPSSENLRKFLESDDPALVMMGLSMAKGSGVAEELWLLVLKVKLWGQDASIRKAAATLLKKEAPPDLREKMKANLFRRNTARINDVGKLHNICQELSSLGLDDARPIERIIQMLEDDDGKKAAEALGKIGDTRAVEPLIKALGNRNKDVRRNAAWALGEIGDERAVEPLIKALEEEEEGDNWYWLGALEDALVKLGEPAVGPLIKALEDVNEHVRNSAAEALGKIGDVRAVKPLIKAAEEDSFAAINALGHIGDERAVEPLTRIFGVGKGEKWLRSTVACTLGELGWEPDTDDIRAAYLIAKGDWEGCLNLGEPAVEHLIESLTDEDWGGILMNHEENILIVLGEIGDSRAVDPVIRFVIGGRFYYSKNRKIWEGLRKFGAPAIQLLSEALGDEHVTNTMTGSTARSSAAEALGEIGDVRAVEPLIKALECAVDEELDHDKFLGYAVQALGKIGDERAIEPLRKMLEDERNTFSSYGVEPQVRLWALKRFGLKGLQSIVTAGKAEQLSVPELKMILKEKKLPTSGKKEDLIERLKEAE